MNFKLLKYEIKQIESAGWEMVSEAEALELLQNSFSKITPIITEMQQGKEVIRTKGIMRIKKMIE